MGRYIFRRFFVCASILLIAQAASAQHAQPASVPSEDDPIADRPVVLLLPVFSVAEPGERADATIPLVAEANHHAPVKAGCRGGSCDGKAGGEFRKAVASSHKGVFYENNFDYILDPNYDEWWPGDRLKRMQFGDLMTLDIGGQYRMRVHNERNHRGLGLTGTDDDFLLHRTRIFANAEIGDRLRLYAEMLDAESNYENFPPRPIEVNRAELQNAFVDLKLFEHCGGELWGRVGRQELMYGNQRLVSPLDWANTRRTFEGYKLYYEGRDWNVDAFYTRPIFPAAKRFDTPDYDQEFTGIYATYEARPNQTHDFYYLRYNDGDAGFRYDTLGARCQGSRGPWLWEVEGAVQFGDNADGSDHSAGFVTAGAGHSFDHITWKPTLWFYYDWASGSDDRGASNGFNHLFPLAHKYLGFMDLYGRQNLETPNLLLTFSPHEKIKLLAWYYYFFLENKNDTPYSVVNTPFNAANAPASANLGHELDLMATYTINARMQILFGYSHFFAGDYYKLTPGVPFRGDADFFYTEYTFDF